MSVCCCGRIQLAGKTVLLCCSKSSGCDGSYLYCWFTGRRIEGSDSASKKIIWTRRISFWIVTSFQAFVWFQCQIVQRSQKFHLSSDSHSKPILFLNLLPAPPPHPWVSRFSALQIYSVCQKPITRLLSYYFYHLPGTLSEGPNTADISPYEHGKPEL